MTLSTAGSPAGFRLLSILLSVLIHAGTGNLAPAQSRTADLVFLGGTVHTMDAAVPAATAVAVKGNRILAVGSDEFVRSLSGPSTKVVDLAGKTVIPGFIESHGHLLGTGYYRLRLDLSGVKNYDEMVQMVRAAVAETPPGEWILGRGWHQSKWDSPPVPEVRGFQTHDALSAVSPDNPVWLRHASGHAGIANAKAMELAGVDSSTTFAEGGEVIKDGRGRPTGIFIELAQSLIGDRVPEETPLTDHRAYDRAVSESVSRGVTTFVDAGTDRAHVEFYRRALAEGPPRMRLSVMVGGREDMKPEELFAAPPDTGSAGGFLTVRALKLGIDGALGSRSAWLMEPYLDDPGNIGQETLPVEDLVDISRRALETGYQVCVHAIGDRANHEVLDAFERVFSEKPSLAKTARFRIEHAQILDSADIPRFGRLGVIASVQGIHCTSDRPWAPSRIGEERIAEGAYAWRKLRNTGAVLVNGTDTPVEAVDPLKCFYASVTRQQPDGTPPGGFDPGEKMTREEALRSYTIDAAYGIFRERDLGSLSPGKLADLVVLSSDPLTVPEEELLSVAVVSTVVDGRFVFGGQE